MLFSLQLQHELGVSTCMMKMIIPLSVLALSTVSSFARGPKPMEIGASEQAIGTPSVAWYTTWDTALEEAKRSQRPIFFMAAAAQCNGVSGVF